MPCAPLLAADLFEREALQAARKTSFSTFHPASTLQRFQGNRELLGRMAGLFGMQWRDLAREGAQACVRRDGATLQLKADRLKHSLASFGAKEARRIAEQLQQLAGQHDFQPAEQHLARLTVEIERLIDELKAFAKQSSN